MRKEDLIWQVADIDIEAALYLATAARALSTYVPGPNCSSLSSIMAWCDTPQGHDYWSNINKKLHKEPEHRNEQ